MEIPADTVLARVRRLFAGPTALHLELDDEAALALHARALLVRNARVAALFLGVGDALWLYGDRFVLEDASRQLVFWPRVAVAVVIALAFLWLSVPQGRRRPSLVLGPAALVACGASGFMTGRLGPLDTPWFHFCYLLFPVMALWPVRLSTRLLGDAALLVAVVSGYLLERPDALSHPFARSAAGVLFFSWAASQVLGEVVYQQLRRGFFSERRFGALTRSLEARVAEQTADLRALAQHLEDTRERERGELAQAVHDELGQELAAMRFALGLAQQRYESNPGSIGKNLEELDALVAGAGLSTQQLVASLRPRLLDEHGLLAALEWLCERSRERFDLALQFAHEGPLDKLARDTELSLFRFVQEALTNAVRHGHARRAQVTLRSDGAAVSVTVRDEGAGFDPDVVPQGALGGMGLRGLRERARARGGSLRIVSAPGQGSALTLTLPLDDASEAALPS